MTTWSPDGSKIAYEVGSGSTWNIYVMNAADGSGKTRLTSFGDSRYPSWSPNGNQIAFSREISGRWQIWVMNADGSNPHSLVKHFRSEQHIH